MRHHGAPTRLLDFTYSIYVAAYFALEEADKDDGCTIWAVNGMWALKQSKNILQLIDSKKTSAKRMFERTQEFHEKDYNNLLFKEPFVKCAWNLNPFCLNQRLRTQNALFIAPGTVSDSFMDNLCALKRYNQPKNCIKIVIPYKLRKKALEHLFYMNISRTSLFPGLDGYAQSLGVYHPTFGQDKYSKLRRPYSGK